MARPTKRRYVRNPPQISYFKPPGIPLRDLNEVTLKVEELEALRLKHLQGLTQEEAAKKMKISRSTFQRTLKNAEKKTTEAIVNANALRIEGGNFILPAPMRGRRRCRRRGRT